VTTRTGSQKDVAAWKRVTVEQLVPDNRPAHGHQKTCRGRRRSLWATHPWLLAISLLSQEKRSQGFKHCDTATRLVQRSARPFDGAPAPRKSRMIPGGRQRRIAGMLPQAESLLLQKAAASVGNKRPRKTVPPAIAADSRHAERTGSAWQA